MPENTPNHLPKKLSRLGRGLGSLLGGPIDFGDTPEKVVSQPTQATQPTVASSVTTPTQPSKTTVQVSAPTQAAPLKIETKAPPATQADQVPMTAPVVPTHEAKSHTSVDKPGQTVDNQRASNSTQSIDESAQIWQIPIDRLAPNTQQPRQIFTAEALRDLSASIKEQGILQPITARRLNEREFEIIAGERRWRAAQLAGLHEVPVILKKVTEKESLELAIIENIQRENLNAMEEAEAYEHLLRDYSLTQQQVADRLGKERSTVANSLRLLTLPAEIKLMVKHDKLAAGHAKVLMGLDDSDAQIDLARKVIEEKLSVRATEKLVQQAKEKTKSTQKVATHEVNVSKRLIEGLSTELQKLLGTKIGIDYAEGKGKLSIHYYTDDQLNSIIEKIRKSWHK